MMKDKTASAFRMNDVIFSTRECLTVGEPQHGPETKWLNPELAKVNVHYNQNEINHLGFVCDFLLCMFST